MKKKMNEKKKLQWRLDGLLPIFQFGSRYNRLYRDTAGLGECQGAIRPSGCVLGARSRATTRPAGRGARPACAQSKRQRSYVAT